MNEKLDYAGIQNIIQKLDTIAGKMSEILDTTTNDMKKVNTSECWVSPAAEATINTFLESASKFGKFPKEVLSYSKYLRTILEQYSSKTNIASSMISGTTDTYVSEIK